MNISSAAPWVNVVKRDVVEVLDRSVSALKSVPTGHFNAPDLLASGRANAAHAQTNLAGIAESYGKQIDATPGGRILFAAATQQVDAGIRAIDGYSGGGRAALNDAASQGEAHLYSARFFADVMTPGVAT